jgi:DnaJ-class molecular chaperone
MSLGIKMTENFRGSLYDLLEISPSASEGDIKKAYYRLARTWHPDKNRERKEEAEARFKEISVAYEVLSNPEKRAEYDGLQPSEQASFYSLFCTWFKTAHPESWDSFASLVTLFFGTGLEQNMEKLSVPLVLGKLATTVEARWDSFISFLDSKENLDVEATIEVSLEDRLANAYLPLTYDRKIEGKKTKTTVLYPAREPELEFPAAGSQRGERKGVLRVLSLDKPHPLYTRKEEVDLQINLSISLFTYFYGGELTLPYRDDTLALKLDPLVGKKMEKVLEGKGIPYVDIEEEEGRICDLSTPPSATGDLYVYFELKGVTSPLLPEVKDKIYALSKQIDAKLSKENKALLSQK